MNDAFSLAESTLIQYSVALKLTEYLASETEYVPWSVASTEITKLKNKLYYTEYYSKFFVSNSKFTSGIVTNVTFM